MNHVFVYSWRSPQGRLFRVRPLTSADAGCLVDLFEHMGPESRFLRFNLALPDPDPELVWSEAERMAQVDPQRDGAWLVFTDMPGQPGVPVAGARFIRIDDETAEASMAVRDDFQGMGIGTEMLAFLVRQARAAGIRRLVASAQRSNRALWRLVHKSGLPIVMDSQGSLTSLTLDLAVITPAG
jgi:acetyltransferase